MTNTITNNQNTTTKKELENMLKIDELKNELEFDENGYARDLCDYSGHKYICDVISDIADSNTSIYWADIIAFISENVEEVNDAIAEFGWDGCGGDLYKAGQMAEFLFIEREINEHLEDGLKNYGINYYMEQTGNRDEIPADLWEIIEEAAENNPDYLDEITDAIDEYMQEDDEDADE